MEIERGIQQTITISLGNDMVDQGFLAFLEGLSARKEYFPLGFTDVSGVTYQGMGLIVGDVVYNKQEATATINVVGDLTKN